MQRFYNSISEVLQRQIVAKPRISTPQSRASIDSICARYACFISSGRNDSSIKSYHFGMALENLPKRFAMALSSIPLSRMAVSKSDFLIFFFLPFSVRANSSSSSGITIEVDRGHTPESAYSCPPDSKERNSSSAYRRCPSAMRKVQLPRS